MDSTTCPRSTALPIRDSFSGCKYSGKIETMSILILEQPFYRLDMHNARVRIHQWHELLHKGHQHLSTGIEIHSEHVLCR